MEFMDNLDNENGRHVKETERETCNSFQMTESSSNRVLEPLISYI
jgi:hypothetical protein